MKAIAYVVEVHIQVPAVVDGETPTTRIIEHHVGTKTAARALCTQLRREGHIVYRYPADASRWRPGLQHPALVLKHQGSA